MEMRGMRTVFITIRSLETPVESKFDKDVEWLAECLGVGDDGSVTAMFKTFARAARTGDGLSINQLAEDMALNRSTVAYHLQKLVDAGVVVRESDGMFYLRRRNIVDTVQDIHADVNRMFEEMAQVASDIDASLSLPRRKEVIR